MALKPWLQDGKLVVDGDGHPILCETCPCEPPAGDYCISGYADGDLSACGTCTGGSSPDTWAGCFFDIGTSVYVSGITAAYDACQIDGAEMASAAGVCQIVNVAGTWYLSVYCLKSGGGYELIWQGGKAGGNPDGTYSRTSGCSATPTSLTVVVP